MRCEAVAGWMVDSRDEQPNAQRGLETRERSKRKNARSRQVAGPITLSRAGLGNDQERSRRLSLTAQRRLVATSPHARRRASAATVLAVSAEPKLEAPRGRCTYRYPDGLASRPSVIQQ
nr:hypothetical protein CFP56_07440 [Quercus suber]